MSKHNDIVWVKYKKDIFWPAKVIHEKDEDENLELIYFFDEDTWEPVSAKLKICCWNCKKHDSYVKKGENQESIKRKLSFNRALATAIQEYKDSHKRGRKKGSTRGKRSTVTPPTNADNEVGNNSSLADLQHANLAKIILDNSDDDDDLPEAFSPVRKTAESFDQGDLTWAKYEDYPYWPAVFHSMMRPRKNRKQLKAWVWFVDETWNLRNFKRQILAIPVEHVVPYYCDSWLKEQFQKDGKEFKSEHDFEKCLKCAEEYTENKALGKLKNFFDYQITKPKDEDVSETNADTKNKPGKRKVFQRGALQFKDLLSRNRAKRDSTARQKYKGLLTALDNTRSTLVKIYKEQIPCARHETFMRGSTKEKDSLKYNSGFGPIDDDSIIDEILEKLRKWFDDCKNCTVVNSVTYVSEVWLPEAMILALMESRGVERKIAENMYYSCD